MKKNSMFILHPSRLILSLTVNRRRDDHCYADDDRPDDDRE
jgi:hypothetical protein